jgi:hypothetical protein
LLYGAELAGASLKNAQLQGASLNSAHLQAALFVDVCVWRADARSANWKDTWVAHPETGPKADKMNECDWTAPSFAALKQLVADKVPEGDARRAAMERIERRLDPEKALEGENEMAKFWAAREREAPTPEVFEKSLIRQWRELGCAPEGAPYVLPALIQQLGTILSPFSGRSDAAMSLGAAFLDDLHCAAAHGLSKAEIATLRDIRDHGVLPAPKP